MNTHLPAFPSVRPMEEPTDVFLGLTKRELFAAMAMQGLVGASIVFTPKDAAIRAVKCADYLLGALEPKA